MVVTYGVGDDDHDDDDYDDCVSMTSSGTAFTVF